MILEGKTSPKTKKDKELMELISVIIKINILNSQLADVIE